MIALAGVELRLMKAGIINAESSELPRIVLTIASLRYSERTSCGRERDCAVTNQLGLDFRIGSHESVRPTLIRRNR
jgi:hypothetical protein